MLQYVPGALCGSTFHTPVLGAVGHDASSPVALPRLTFPAAPVSPALVGTASFATVSDLSVLPLRQQRIK